ncbi:MAG: class I SAM-dependent methyltransferase [Hyphomicrobiales bacterium]
MLSQIDRLSYTARQAARVAWYMGHYFAAQPYREKVPEGDVRRERPRSKPPGRDAIFRAMGELFERDLKNVEAGFYPVPRDDDGNGSLRELVRRSRKFFADIPVSAERKSQRRGAEVYSPELAEKLPAYFLQNFHYQTGGYLTEESAELYDMQVEVLFSGTANAMRRQCLVPIAEWMRGKDQRKVSVADVACGTGRFLKFLKQTWPRVRATGTDLSESYLAEARRHLNPYTDVELLPANAEALPFPDASLDVVVSIYLFHEVPPKVRRIIAGEFARVLKPGGRLVFMDSLQRGDTPDFDALLEGFPLNFHEPFYPSYVGENLPAMFEVAGLRTVRTEPVFLSKLVVADKPL